MIESIYSVLETLVEPIKHLGSTQTNPIPSRRAQFARNIVTPYSCSFSNSSRSLLPYFALCATSLHDREHLLGPRDSGGTYKALGFDSNQSDPLSARTIRS